MTRQIFRISYVLLAAFALIGQFIVAINRPEIEADKGTVIVNFFSYFTVETNLLAMVVMTASILAPQSWLASANMRGPVVVYISIVALVYHTMLANLLSLNGIAFWLDQALHTALPALFVLDWILFVDKSALRLAQTPKWLIFPLVFCAYSMARGAVTGWYPYPFLDPNNSNATTVAITIFGMVIVFMIGSVLVVLMRRNNT